MKFTDTKIGMKIKRIGEDHKDVKKGSVYTIEKAHCGGVGLKGMGDYWYDLVLFEPVVMELEQPKDEPINKFEVGEEARFHNNKVKIWAFRYDEELKEYEYAVIDDDEKFSSELLWESELSPLKKPDELEVGDKFVNKISNSKLEVLATAYDDKCEIKRYFCKREDGLIGIWAERDVKDIIYD